MKDFDADFIKFTKMIVSDNNFSYARYADGEVMLMKGIPVGINTQAFLQDKWSSTDHISLLGLDLLKTLLHTESNYYYAITSPNQSLSDYTFLSSNIKQHTDNITFSDLWINANYPKFKKFIMNLDIPVNLIANQNCVSQKNIPLIIKDIFPIKNDCVNYYQNNKEQLLIDVSDFVKNKINELFFISAGPLSEIIIHQAYSTNPNNKYIDVGSAIDEFVHGRATRPYMIPNSFYATQKILWS